MDRWMYCGVCGNGRATARRQTVGAVPAHHIAIADPAPAGHPANDGMTSACDDIAPTFLACSASQPEPDRACSRQRCMETQESGTATCTVN